MFRDDLAVIDYRGHNETVPLTILSLIHINPHWIANIRHFS